VNTSLLKSPEKKSNEFPGNIIGNQIFFPSIIPEAKKSLKHYAVMEGILIVE
jgi:hypothetical protein